MESTFAQNPIYVFDDNGIEPLLQRVVPFLGSRPYRNERVTKMGVLECFRSALATGSPDAAFLLAILVLMQSEPDSRELIRRMSNRKLRSIKVSGRPVSAYLRRAIKSDYRYQSKKKGGEIMTENFDEIVSELLGPVKKGLGLPPDNPVASSYPVSTAVIASAADPDCRLHLEILTTRGAVYSWQLDQECRLLRERFPRDAETVIETLMAGETRDHVAGMSLTASGRDSTVTIVNNSGRVLTMQGRKFEALIEDCGKTKLLGVIGAKSHDYTRSIVTFTTTVQQGEVMACYEPKSSILHVAVVKMSDGDVGDTTTYVLDSDTVACMYLALRRQRLDRQRFEQLMDAAETRVEVDPFQHLGGRSNVHEKRTAA